MMKLIAKCALVLLGGIVNATAATAADDLKVATVTYVTGSSIYLDAGANDGLQVGAKLELRRDELLVATIEISEVSSNRAVGKIAQQQLLPAIGDHATFAPVVRVEPKRVETDSRAKPRRRRPVGIGGRVGVQYWGMDDRTQSGGGYSQPALNLRLDGSQMGGSPWGFDVDIRARRTFRNDPALEDVSATRAYRMNVSHQRQESGWRFALGRQVAPQAASISIFDGLSVDYDTDRWGAGIVSGSQPDPTDYGYSSDITEHGFYFRLHNRAASKSRWNVVAGAIGSYRGSEVSREFVYVLGRYSTRRFWLYASQELDINRDWKVSDFGEESIAPTSSFVSMTLRASKNLSIRGGYDNRRNVRLIRDRVTPISDFDDSFRRGAWIGANLRFQRRYSLGVDSRFNSGGTAGDSNSYGMSFGVHSIGSNALSAFTRVNRYTNDQVEGWFYQADVGLDLTAQSRLSARIGTRDESNLRTIPQEDTLDWYGLTLDFYIGNRWYATVEVENTEGAVEKVTQYFTTLSYRF